MPNYKSDQMQLAAIYGWYVYVLAEEGGEYSKIGTAQRPQFRVGTIQNGNPRRLKIAMTWHMQRREDAFSIEVLALAMLGDARLPGRDWVHYDAIESIAAVRSAIVGLGIKTMEAHG